MHYHLIGIGGIGMSGIAQLLIARGINVSGSDVRDSKITKRLSELGAHIFIGHNASNIKGADVVVYSSAIQPENPEIVEAKKIGIPLIRRAQALAELMKDKTVVTVTGSHGKTTTASLVSLLLIEAGLMPTVAIGGILRNIETNAFFGEGELFVAEADESDGSFLHYRPKYSIITNIDREHLDYYKTFENEVIAFEEFLSRTEKNGCVFACSDDPVVKKLVSGYNGKCVLFGFNAGSDISAKNIKIKGLSSEFDCFYRDKFVERFNLPLGGMHNISNSLSVIALGLELGIDTSLIKRTLAAYKGAGRRLEVKLNDEKYTIIDDYAHHPTEITQTLKAVRDLDAQRLIAIFQPHRFTRTKLLLNEFSSCFESADYIIVTSIYAASEAPIDGISASSIIEGIKKLAPHKEVHFLPKEEIVSHILKIIKPKDLVITLGAGDISKTCDELVARIKG